MPIMSKLTAAYLAGFVDGEGYIGLLKHRRTDRDSFFYRPVIGISSTDKEIIDWLKNSFGGYVGIRKSENAKTGYEWHLYDTTMRPFLLKIMPYLKLKKEKAEILNKVIKIILVWKEGKRTRKHTPDYWETMENYYQQLRQLNKRGLVHVDRLTEATLRGSDSQNSTEQQGREGDPKSSPPTKVE